MFEENSLLLESLNRNSLDLKVEGYSTQFEAICQRIDMIELEMENLKSHHINVLQSQKVKDTRDQSTKIGLSLNVSTSKSKDFEHSLKRGSSTSPETRDAWKGFEIIEPPKKSLLERLRNELD